MKAKTGLIMVEIVLLAIATSLFYMAYTFSGMINKIGFATFGLWIIYMIAESYVRKYIKNRVKKEIT